MKTRTIMTTVETRAGTPAGTALSALFACLLGLAAPLTAHHSMSAVYDDLQPVRLEGVVTKYDWSNPHVWVFVELRSQSGRIEEWEVEFASRLELRRNGWTRDSVKLGDSVIIEASRARSIPNRAHGKFLTVNAITLIDTAVESTPPSPSQLERELPRWSDGHPRLGPAPGQSGYWAAPSAAAMYEATGTPIAMNDEGLLANIADAPRVAPFRDWALGLYRYRQQNFLKDDPMAACLPPGGPRQFQAPFGMQFLQQPERDRLFVLSRGGNRNWRLVPLDGREVPEPEDETPTYFGFSSGRWEEDTLVIDSAGYIERFWFSNGGLPHTEQLRLTEHITRRDYNTLEYEVTVNDTGAYTRPWTARWTLRWFEGGEEDEYFCDDYNRELEHVN